MNKIQREKLWVIMILCVIGMPFSLYFLCNKVTDLKTRRGMHYIQELSFKAVVVEKKIDSMNRLNRYFVFKAIDDEYILSENYYRINLDTIWREINIGDSIIKRVNENRLIKIRNNDKDTYWFNNF